MYSFMNSMETVMLQKKGRSCAVNQENATGEKGKGGMAASALGPSGKGAPCIPGIAPGETRRVHAEISSAAASRGTVW